MSISVANQVFTCRSTGPWTPRRGAQPRPRHWQSGHGRSGNVSFTNWQVLAAIAEPGIPDWFRWQAGRPRRPAPARPGRPSCLQLTSCRECLGAAALPRSFRHVTSLRLELVTGSGSGTHWEWLGPAARDSDSAGLPTTQPSRLRYRIYWRDWVNNQELFITSY